MERATRDTDDERLRTMLARLQETRVRTITATTTLTEGDDVVRVDTTSGSVTVNLPPARQVLGHKFLIKKVAAANTVTVDANGSDTIDGSGTLAWTTQYESYTIVAYIVALPATYGWEIV